MSVYGDADGVPRKALIFFRVNDFNDDLANDYKV